MCGHKDGDKEFIENGLLIQSGENAHPVEQRVDENGP
jgi:hypothetical protein